MVKIHIYRLRPGKIRTGIVAEILVWSITCHFRDSSREFDVVYCITLLQSLYSE